MAERVKEQEFEEGFLHGWDGSECIYYTDEKCLYYNDAEAPLPPLPPLHKEDTTERGNSLWNIE